MEGPAAAFPSLAPLAAAELVVGDVSEAAVFLSDAAGFVAVAGEVAAWAALGAAVAFGEATSAAGPSTREVDGISSKAWRAASIDLKLRVMAITVLSFLAVEKIIL